MHYLEMAIQMAKYFRSPATYIQHLKTIFVIQDKSHNNLTIYAPYTFLYIFPLASISKSNLYQVKYKLYMFPYMFPYKLHISIKRCKY